MKKEDLIKKAHERGIAIDETQADKYIALSDDELENLAVAGGCNEKYRHKLDNINYAQTCTKFVSAKPSNEGLKCTYCTHFDTITLMPSLDIPIVQNYCLCAEAWQ
ncbi:MAG: hypothetical protein LBM59_07690 [Ruminococcus sp.]|jgi:hypothetical protein|nr:hypothetical protein [Ruminococcus sp.]